MSQPPSFVTTRDVAEALGVSVETVIGWIRDGKLDARQPAGPSGHYRIPAGEIDRLLNRRPVPTAAAHAEPAPAVAP